MLRHTKRTRSDMDIGAYQEMVTCPGRTRTDKGSREGSPGTYVDGDPVNIRVGLLRIGDIVFASVNGEPYNAIGLRLKRESPLRNTMLITNTNGRANSGYIPSDYAFGRNTSRFYDQD